MATDNTLLIIEEDHDHKKEAEEEKSLKKVCKQQHEEFVKDNAFNQTTEIIHDEFESQIEKSMDDLEGTLDVIYDSDSEDDEIVPSNGHKKLINEYSPLESSSEESDEELGRSCLNSQLIESHVLQRRVWDESSESDKCNYHPQGMLPFYGRRRLSECVEEDEDDEKAPTANGVSAATEIAGAKRKFIVTKTLEEDSSVELRPVGILKKTPSPPFIQKKLGSPKKIRIEAESLRDVPARKNSQTIHFPCNSVNSPLRVSAMSFFSPQGRLNPHLDKRYFDTSLVEVRTSQSALASSTKSLDKNVNVTIDDDVWVKRKEAEKVTNGVSRSNSAEVYSRNSFILL